MKCTPDQIMLYQIALRLHKLVNDHSNVLSFEHVTVMDQIICTRRQIKFQILRKFNHKIGLNTTANKFYHLNNLISPDSLNLNFVHYKKIMKIQFLKNGRTQAVNSYHWCMSQDVKECTLTEGQSLCNEWVIVLGNLQLRTQNCNVMK